MTAHASPSHALKRRPIVAVTAGDPAGIGPELCLRLLERQEAMPASGRSVVFGDRFVLERARRELGCSTPLRPCRLVEWPDDEANVVHVESIDAERVVPGAVGAATGRAAHAYIVAAIDAAVSGTVGAVTTAPIHKEALRAAGIDEPGHTEIFARRTGARRACMMLTAPELTCSFVTTHVGYRDVPALLTKERISDVIDLTHQALTRLTGREPELAVCGLNPHAGEHGLFGGGEEEAVIVPAIAEARRRGRRVEGPLPPDTAFLPERRRRTDGFVCMYHDQGHIPLKALAFDQAVNVTLGLPIVRTSVDHGTALDIAWRGVANPTSLFRAVELAARLAG